jgi:hypothetical protein
MTEYKCPKCGSDDLSTDAHASANPNSPEEASEPYFEGKDFTVCVECSHEGDLRGFEVVGVKFNR